MRLTRPSWSAYALIMGRWWTGYTSISGSMLGIALSHGGLWLLEPAWRLQPSYGYGLIEATIPSEKMHLIAALRGAECEVEHVISGVKRCRIVHDVFRNTKAQFDDL